MKNCRRTYNELVGLETFADRFRYLQLNGNVGDDTFGSKRYLNQSFYTSREWRQLRSKIIMRDNGCDLGIAGFEYGPSTQIVLHHIEPIQIEDVIAHSDLLLDPDNIISCSLLTHNAIHYGNLDMLGPGFVDRAPYDMCPWRK